MQRASKSDGLLALRQVFIAFVLAIAMFQFVLTFLAVGDDAKPALALAALAVGAVSCFVVGPKVERPLDVQSAKTLAASYQTRFFVRVACSEAAALFAFVAFFVANVRWVYPIGALISYAGFFRAAPTRGHLSEDQAELRRRGSSLSLVAALRGNTRTR